ncbi:ATP-binding protein [Aquirufa sp. 5-AUSEE-100C1]
MGLNYNNIAEDFTPDPFALLESNRNLGYSIEEAISDLIDNSISAKSTEIELRLNWNNCSPYFKIIDNGNGMNLNELIHSFKLGSLKERNKNDLGRFGFGMKTASISQARKLIIISKKESFEPVARSLDLDFIQKNNSWNLIKPQLEDFEEDFDYLEKRTSGTILIWNNWDRAPQDLENFASQIVKTINYISVCFHRFLENQTLKIIINDIKIIGINPIPNSSTLSSTIKLSDQEDTTLNSYSLQHPIHWDEDYENATFRFNSYCLFNGFEQQQGIYIYRLNRLITPYGGWRDLMKSKNSSKLARVKIDIPNNTEIDEKWNLEITKTNANIPYDFIKEIILFVEKTKILSGVKVNGGGRKIQKDFRANYENATIWKDQIEKSSYQYKINENHPIFQILIQKSLIDLKTLKIILNVIESNLPISKIIENNDLKPTHHDRIKHTEKLGTEYLKIAKELYSKYRLNSNHHESLIQLFKCEPFYLHQEQIKSFLNE